MEINGIQLVFILIALAEWIFLDAQEVHRGSLSDGWLFPNNLESVKFASILCVLLAFYLGKQLIYQKGKGTSEKMVMRKYGVLWALFFYVPYLLYGFIVDIKMLFFEAGCIEGVIFCLIKMTAAIWLAVKIYKMLAVLRIKPILRASKNKKMSLKKDVWEKIFVICSLIFPLLMWANYFSSEIDSHLLLMVLLGIKLSMLIYIMIWPLCRQDNI